jgi:hypothetical protein
MGTRGVARILDFALNAQKFWTKSNKSRIHVYVPFELDKGTARSKIDRKLLEIAL